MKRVIFTGGGSGGHVIPAITLIKKLKEQTGYDVYYVGSQDGIEAKIVKEHVLKYFPISTGKLRRYLSFKNLVDVFKIFKGLVDSFIINLKFSRKETLVFGTGGFVSVPFVIISRLFGKTVFIHEQTTRAGLANKICSIFANRIFVSFEESLNYFPSKKTIYSGYPLRDECYDNNIRINQINGFTFYPHSRPLLFVTGGGNGSLLINRLIKSNFHWLKESYVVIHQVGNDHIEKYSKFKSDSYYPVGFIGPEILDIMKASEIVISRAGAGTVAELLALKKRSIFIPLKIAQKNEQYHNAKVAERELNSLVITEDQIGGLNLDDLISDYLKNSNESKPSYILKKAEDIIVNSIRSNFE